MCNISNILEFMISVIVPVYNSEATLYESVRSILAQSYKDLEVILINDGSTDNSPKICDGFKHEDDRVIVIHKTNEGAAKARNDGLKIAKGDYIGFVDSDDFIDSNMYAHMWDLAQKHNADIVQCGHEKISTDGEILYRSGYTECVINDNKKIFHQYCKQDNTDNYSPTKIYRRSIIENVYFGELHYSEDAVFIMQAFLKCSTLVVTGKLFYKYIQTPLSMCRRPFSLKFTDTVKAGKYMYEKCMQRYPEYATYFAFYTAMWARYCYCGAVKIDKKLSEELLDTFNEYYKKIRFVNHLNKLSLSIFFFKYFRNIYLRVK